MNKRKLLKSLLSVSTVFIPGLPKPETFEELIQLPTQDALKDKVGHEVVSVYLAFLSQFYLKPLDKVTCIKLASSVEQVLNAYTEQGLMSDSVVICDDSNNPPSVLNTGILALFVSCKASNGQLINVSIGPMTEHKKDSV